jgi:hypothetical protein
VLGLDTNFGKSASMGEHFQAHPKRFKNRRPVLPPMPAAAGITPPPEEQTPTCDPVARTLNSCPRMSQSL